MKKAVVLFISLLVITTLSILVLENLNDTNKFLVNSHDKFNKIQAISLMDNLQSEISKKLKENQTSTKDIIDSEILSNAMLSINEKTISFSLLSYDKININNLINNDKNIVKNVSDILYSYEVYNIDFLKQFLKTNTVQNSKQLDLLIDQYVKQEQDEKILEVKSLLGFLENKDLYELKVNLNDNFGSKMSSYYILDHKGEVRYLEYSIN